MAANMDDIVIAGGGLAAIRTAQALRDAHFKGRIVVLSEEACLPYDRPPLSKNYLLGKLTDENIRLLSAEKLTEQGIEVRLSSRVVGLDRAKRQLHLVAGGAVEYGRLVVATGARPIQVPALKAFGNVHVLRQAEDAQRLRSALRPGQHIGIVGAGFIGLEIASVAIGLGCSVTIVEAAETPLAAIIGKELGQCIRGWHERKGVSFKCGTMVVGASGEGQVRALELNDGTSLSVDAVLVGVGQTPNVEWLENSGLELHRGLVCDEFGRTADPLIFGVGDVVCQRIGDVYHPTRHWTAASEQARRVAGLLCGEAEDGPLIEDNYFWSDQYGSRLQFVGVVPKDPRLVWVSGGPEEEKFVVLCCTPEHVTAVFSLGSPRDFTVHSMPLRRGEVVAVPAA